MTEFFRFRSMKYLLKKEYQELEKQTIYFASPEELNDPMEGFRDIVWGGDKIVWTNFFKNYVCCLHLSYYQLRTEGDSIQLDDLPISVRWDKLPTPQKELFDDIWHRFLNVPNIREIIEALANTKREIRYQELGYYLRAIHPVLFVEVVKSYIAHQLVSESEKSQFPPTLLKLILNSIKQDEQVKSEKERSAISLERERLDESERVIQQYNSYTTSMGMSEQNNQLVVFDFPRVYLKELERLLWPRWYTACFMKSYHNSSVWGNYADNHTGVCLIFEAAGTDKSNRLELNQITGKRPRTLIRFRKVSYAGKARAVDFFRSIGRLRVPVLIKLWYTDSDGNRSKCAAHIGPAGNKKDVWRKSYWQNFYRDITIKTKDWKYEQEYRLILRSRWSKLDEKKNRTRTYNFNSLKGIIFGIKTSDDDRLRIIEIIEEKCKENNRTDFKFFQAYYSPEDGNIRKYEIKLPLSNAKNMQS